MMKTVKRKKGSAKKLVNTAEKKNIDKLSTTESRNTNGDDVKGKSERAKAWRHRGVNPGFEPTLIGTPVAAAQIGDA